MGELEEIESAIAKLTEMKVERNYFEFNGWLCEESPGDTARSYLEPDSSASPITNDELMVTLYRTIEPQLAILQSARDQVAAGSPDEPFSVELALDLARYLNGVTS